MQVGTAWEDITPDRPLHLLGQMAIRTGEYTRDPLTTNAVVLDDGTQRLAMVSIDVCVLPADLVNQIKQRGSEASGITPENIIVIATHTHVAPCTTDLLFGDVDADWVEQLFSATAKAAPRGGRLDRVSASRRPGLSRTHGLEPPR